MVDRLTLLSYYLISLQFFRLKTCSGNPRLTYFNFYQLESFQLGTLARLRSGILIRISPNFIETYLVTC